MKSSTLQFVVAGSLIAAWAWMLGRPILTNLFRRSRRDSVGHFRYQQAVLSQPMGEQPRSRSWSDRPRPFADWRAQSVERRRLQLMLGFSLATFTSLLLAIALRGSFIRLFALMAVTFVAYIGVAVYIGSSQLRRMERGERNLVSAVAPSAEPPVAAAEPQASADEHDGEASVLEGRRSVLFGDRPEEEDYDDHEFFGQGIFDEGFYEPIPELTFKPLNLDDSLLQPVVDRSEPGSLFAHLDRDPEPEAAPAAGLDFQRDRRVEPGDQEVGDLEVGYHEAGDQQPSEDYSWVGQPILEFEPLTDESDYVPVAEDPVLDDPLVVGDDPMTAGGGAVEEPELESEPVMEQEAVAEDQSMVDPEPVADPEPVTAQDQTRPEATFTAPPQPRTRPPKRNKARPIYIESSLDEEDERAKAVND